MTIEFGAYSINTWPVGVLLLASIMFFLYRSGKYRRWYLACVLLFGIYALYAIDQVFFPIAVSGAFAEAARQSPLGGNYNPRFNFIPLSFGPAPDLYHVVLTSSLNMVLTVPFGFSLPFIAPVKAKHFWWIPFIVGFGLEGMQLIISILVRYLYRVIDVNDVIFNALGVMIGYALFRLFARFYIAVMHRLSLGSKQRGLTAYVYTIATRS